MDKNTPIKNTVYKTGLSKGKKNKYTSEVDEISLLLNCGNTCFIVCFMLLYDVC